MKLIFSIATLFTTIILGACTTTQMAADAMQARFVGKSMDSFVVEHGPPLSEYQMEDGGFLYEWSSGIRKTINLPATTSYSGVTNPYSYSGVGQTIGGGPIEMECRLRIVTDKHKIIKDFTITKDSIGAWETSRCNEVLSG